MAIKLITATILHCTCVWCKHEWDTFTKPKRCAHCKRHTWNGEDDRRNDPMEFVPPRSRVKGVPALRHKDVAEALMAARGIIDQLIADYGPCDHDNKEKPNCVCYEMAALKKIDKQIAVLSQFGGEKPTSRRIKAP